MYNFILLVSIPFDLILDSVSQSYLCLFTITTRYDLMTDCLAGGTVVKLVLLLPCLVLYCIVDVWLVQTRE